MLAPAPGPTPAAAAPPPQTACSEPRRQQAVASAGSARHMFYLPNLGGKFEPFSLLSGRASGRQKVGLQGRPTADGQQRCQGREIKPGEEDHRQKGAPWRLLMTLLWEGL